LRDETGGRRFWPIRAGKTDLDALARDRDELFAEAVRVFRDDKPWWPDRRFKADHMSAEQEARYEHDAWEEAIDSWLTSRTRVTVLEAAKEALHMETPRIGTADQRRIAPILERLGWRRARDWQGR
jgi:predicted P-loop ATPase